MNKTSTLNGIIILNFSFITILQCGNGIGGAGWMVSGSAAGRVFIAFYIMH